MRWAKLLLVIMFAALTFGGSFTCFASSGDRHHHNSSANDNSGDDADADDGG